MNNDILAGEWKQIKGEFIKAYGELTEDDLEKARGKRMQVVGLLQEKYGQSEEEAKHNVDRVIDHYNDMYWEGHWNQVRGEVQKAWGELTDNDLDRIAGSRRRLVGVLQEKYGRSQEQAWQEVRQLMN
ncbi:MAG: CsbD family protein [Ardenticatenaceae bacterium]|nr:CsbD family protein [Ardenticatenaceae bacterium]